MILSRFKLIKRIILKIIKKFHKLQEKVCLINKLNKHYLANNYKIINLKMNKSRHKKVRILMF